MLGDAGGHAHGRDRLGIAPARLHQRVARCSELRGAARRSPSQHFGQQGQRDEDDRAADCGKPDIGMEQKADAEVDRQPRQVEQSDRAGAGEEAAYGVEVADRLRAFAPDAERERQADDGVIDAQAQRFVEAVADADQDPAADSVDDALCGVESRRQDKKGDEGRNAAARYHPIVDFEHEQGAGEHQNVAHPAEQGDGQKGPPAGAECSRKLCTCGRLPQRAGKLAHAGGAYHLGARKATIELIRDNRPHRAWDLPGALAIPTFVSILFLSGNADRFAVAEPLPQARS